MFSPICIGGDFIFNYVIAANTLNFNLKTAAIAAGWNQVMPLKATVTVNAGVYVGSSSPATYAFDTGTTFPFGSTLDLINNGAILGRGGHGANSDVRFTNTAGESGGPALRAQAPIAVTNNGIIGGGGGGGGSGGVDVPGSSYASNDAPNGGKGGGGRGHLGGAAGIFTWGTPPITGETAGTTTTSGVGSPGYAGSGTGGNGGTLGAAGTAGSSAAGGAPGGAAGYGGACTNGNANITWVATGTRYGTLG